MIKVVVVVLVLIVVLFIVLAVWGSSKNASEPKPTSDAFNSQPHPALESFNGMLAPFAPKLELAKKTFDLSNVSPAVAVSVTIPKDESHKFRIAKFHLSQSGCARMEYKAPDNDGGDSLNDQKWPGNKKVDPTQASFTILQSGGTLILTHNAFPTQPCVVQLQ